MVRLQINQILIANISMRQKSIQKGDDDKYISCSIEVSFRLAYDIISDFQIFRK